MNSRKKSFTINSSVSIFSQVIQLFFRFFIRKQFIVVFGIEILGLNSTFVNVLNLLNLSEMGIGFAITYHLYKPLHDKDYNTINLFLNIYSNFYKKIITFVSICGFLLIPILPILVKTSYSLIFEISVIYLLQLGVSISTYIYAHRRIIYNVNEQNFVVSLYEMIFNIILGVFQIFVLFTIKNYILYAILEIFKNIILNYVLHLKAKKKFNYIQEDGIDKLETEKLMIIIKKDLKNVMIVKLGAYVLNSTDFLVISMFLGSVASGQLANYSMIFITIQTFILTAMNSIQSIIGNFSVSNEENKENIEKIIVKLTLFLTLLIIIIAPISYKISNVFIELWVGKEFLLSNLVPFMYSLNLSLMLLSNPIGLLFGAIGYFKFDRNIILFSASLNIIISILLIFKIHIVGVLIGTSISILIYWVSRVFILKKYYFGNINLYIKNIIYFISMIVGAYILITVIPTPSISNFFMFFIEVFKLVIIIGIYLIITLAIYFAIFTKKRRKCNE